MRNAKEGNEGNEKMTPTLVAISHFSLRISHFLLSLTGRSRFVRFNLFVSQD